MVHHLPVVQHAKKHRHTHRHKETDTHTDRHRQKKTEVGFLLSEMVLAQLPPWWKLRSRSAAPRATLRDQASHVRSRLAARTCLVAPRHRLSLTRLFSHCLRSFSSSFFSMFSFELLSGHGSGSAQNLSATASEINCENYRICICIRN